MSNPNPFNEENKTQYNQDEQPNNTQPRTDEQIVADLVAKLDYLFNPNNLMRNSYLTKRANGISFEIPIRFIYEEFSVKTITQDSNLIHQALAQAQNVVVNKKENIIESVRPKQTHVKIRLDIKGLKYEEKEDFYKYVQTLVQPNQIFDYNFNERLAIVEIVCDSEQSAAELHQALREKPFEANPDLDISLVPETLYITCSEAIKKNKRFNNGMKPRPNPGYKVNGPYMNPNYGYYQQMMPMQYPNQYQQQYYMQNMMMMNQNPYQKMGQRPYNNYNPNYNSYNKKQYYDNQGGPNMQNQQGGPNSHYKGKKNNNNQGNYKKGPNPNKKYKNYNNPPKVEINNMEFPPLSEDGNPAPNSNPEDNAPNSTTNQ